MLSLLYNEIGQLLPNATSLAHIQTKAYDDDEVASILFSELLLLAATVAAMMWLTFNIFGKGEKLYLPSWKSQVKSKRLNATEDYSKKYVLVTGCDRGLGQEMAKALDRKGFSVIAGCLNVETDSVRQLKQQASPKLSAVQLDVTNEEDLNKTSSWMKQNMKGELWGVVNNAGVCFVGTPEIMANSDISDIIGVNFIGTVNVTKKFLPQIRNSGGRIVNIGSMNGEVPLPFFSLYNATKAAVKSLTESLAYELKDWGVKVCLVAPSGFKTDIIKYDRVARANKWWAQAAEETKQDYGKDYFTMQMRESGRLKLSQDYTPVTDSVVDALTSDSPKTIYRAGHGSSLLPMLCNYLPGNARRYFCGSILNFISSRPQALAINTNST